MIVALYYNLYSLNDNILIITCDLVVRNRNKMFEKLSTTLTITNGIQ